jgi:membrane protease YdiL (CAAX protease family)
MFATRALLQLAEAALDIPAEHGGLLPLLGTFAVIWYLIRFRRQRWSDLGLRRPASAKKALLVGVVLAVVLTLVAIVLVPLVSRLTDAQPDYSRFARLEGNLRLYLQSVATIWVTAALIEELMYRGFLTTRLVTLLGSGSNAWLGAAFFQAILFGLVHYYQGLPGMILTGTVGLIFALFYFWGGRNLWPLIIIHGLIDTFSFTLVYLGKMPGS